MLRSVEARRRAVLCPSRLEISKASGWVVALLSDYATVLELPADASALAVVPAVAAAPERAAAPTVESAAGAAVPAAVSLLRPLVALPAVAEAPEHAVAPAVELAVGVVAAPSAELAAGAVAVPAAAPAAGAAVVPAAEPAAGAVAVPAAVSLHRPPAALQAARGRAPAVAEPAVVPPLAARSAFAALANADARERYLRCSATPGGGPA